MWYIDIVSYSDILVYDNDQWVFYMFEEFKEICVVVYVLLGMGGLIDWVSDM